MLMYFHCSLMYGYFLSEIRLAFLNFIDVMFANSFSEIFQFTDGCDYLFHGIAIWAHNCTFAGLDYDSFMMYKNPILVP